MALVPFPGPGGPDRSAAQGSSSPHDLDPDPNFRTEGNRILRRDRIVDPEPEDEEDGEAKMSFLDHLDELRKRIIWALVSIGIGFIPAFVFINQIFDFIMRPMQRLLPAGQTLIYTDPSEAFMLEIKICLIVGTMIASPLVFTQVWLFIAPGLYSHEKRLAIPFVVMSSVLFIVGAAFSHYVVFPIVWRFFTSFTTDYLTFMPRVEPAFSMYLRLVLALGLTFQLPTIVLFLARMGMITPRFMIRNFKFAVLLIVIAAAVLSPDGGGVGMVAMGGPVILLYILSIGLAWIFGKKRKTEAETEESAE
jgi:sec-independent protein translocase protein TatC